MHKITAQFDLKTPTKVKLFENFSNLSSHVVFAVQSGKRKSKIDSSGWHNELVHEAKFLVTEFLAGNIYTYWPKPELDPVKPCCNDCYKNRNWPELIYRNKHLTYDKVQYFPLALLQESLNSSYEAYIFNQHVPALLRNGVGPAYELFHQLVGVKDDYTWEHSYRVFHLTKLILEPFSESILNSDEQSVLLAAALLHDFGKIATSEVLLWKIADISPREKYWINRHPFAGLSLLCSFQLYAPHLFILPIISHHLYPDDVGALADIYFNSYRNNQSTNKKLGNFYADQHQGQRIQYIFSTIVLKIADAIDARISKRPYRPRGEKPNDVIDSICDNVTNNMGKPIHYRFPLELMPCDISDTITKHLKQNKQKIRAIYAGIPVPK